MHILFCCLVVFMYGGFFFVEFFFFKQKTAYEMRISDWSSDVCSSGLLNFQTIAVQGIRADIWRRRETCIVPKQWRKAFPWLIWFRRIRPTTREIGRASCRERVCQDV